MPNNEFISIAQLLCVGWSAKEEVSAIEIVGFYAWDRFGRRGYILPKSSLVEDNKMREILLDEISKGFALFAHRIDHHAIVPPMALARQ